MQASVSHRLLRVEGCFAREYIIPNVAKLNILFKNANSLSSFCVADAFYAILFLWVYCLCLSFFRYFCACSLSLRGGYKLWKQIKRVYFNALCGL